MAGTDTIVKFQKVSKNFGEIKALDNVSFEVRRGEFVFITGPSGAGKTTLLRLLLGEMLPTTGEIVFEGTNVAKLSPSDLPLLRQKIGVVFQDFKLIPQKTVSENVEVALAIVGTPEKEWEGRMKRILELVGLAHREDLFPSQLSGGELQRLSLARALVVNPRLILADEPTGNLDWETADGIMDLFEKINHEGKTIIMATHHKGIVNKLKKRVIELKNGKLAKS
jgi:cell division transport system ATP-binding protein